MLPDQLLSIGITVEQFSIDGKTIAWDNPAEPQAGYNVPGSTIHAVTLAAPIPSKGSVRIRMRWSYDLVTDKGWKEGAIDETSYFLAYFFARVTNYSDYGGWDYAPFTLDREFNNDFADFSVEVESIGVSVQTPSATPKTSSGPARDGLECLTSVPAQSLRADSASP